MSAIFCCNSCKQLLLSNAITLALPPTKSVAILTYSSMLCLNAGTMTGGGARVTRGRMSSKMQSEYTPEQVLKLKQKLEAEEASYDVS